MDSLTVDNVYSQALYDAACEMSDPEKILPELKAVTEIFKANPELRKLFLLPTVTTPEKEKVCKAIFGEEVSQVVLNFMLVLITKRRIGIWDRIYDTYEKILDEKAGFTRGIIYSVIPIDGDQLKSFEKKAGAAIGKEVRLENRIDKSIVGGVRIYVDGRLIDASVKTRLENMKQAMLGL